MRRNRRVGRDAIIRAVGYYAGNPAVNVIEQGPDLRWIVGILIREGLRHDHAAGSVDRQMQFAPFSS